MPKRKKQKPEPELSGKAKKRLSSMYAGGLEIPAPDGRKRGPAKSSGSKGNHPTTSGRQGMEKARDWLTFNKIFFEILAAVALTAMAVILSWGMINLITR